MTLPRAYRAHREEDRAFLAATVSQFSEPKPEDLVDVVLARLQDLSEKYTKLFESYIEEEGTSWDDLRDLRQQMDRLAGAVIRLTYAPRNDLAHEGRPIACPVCGTDGPTP